MAAKSRRVELETRSERAKVVTKTMRLKSKPKVRGQSESLKVSSLPSHHFLLLSASSLCLKRRR
jgi:hypothetical protein